MAYDYPLALYETQIGVENPAGQQATASIVLPGVAITPKPVVETMAVKRAGKAHKAGYYAVKEYTEAKVEGVPDYEGVLYLLASYLGTPNTTDTGAAGGALQHVWVHTGAEKGKSLTVESNPASGVAFRFIYGMVKSLELQMSRSESETSTSLSGEMFGAALQKGITPTEGTPLPFVPLLPTHGTLYAADTLADLDTAAALEADFSVGLKLGERYRPEWHIKREMADFAGVAVKSEQDIEVSLKVAADDAGLAWLDTLRISGRKYLRIEAVGPETSESGVMYSLTFDLPVMVSEAGEMSDEDGLYAAEWTLKAVWDDALGGVLRATLVNTRQSL